MNLGRASGRWSWKQRKFVSGAASKWKCNHASLHAMSRVQINKASRRPVRVRLVHDPNPPSSTKSPPGRPGFVIFEYTRILFLLTRDFAAYDETMKFAPYKKQVEALSVGKRLPDATYLHKSALPLVPGELARFTLELAAEYSVDFDWNITKYFRRDFKVSFLSYPKFFDESYPALVGSVTIDLVRKKSRKTDYSQSDNPPILHRKETLIAPEHPALAEFASITREGESLGLYENPARIGFKKSWERMISNKGLRVRRRTHSSKN